MRATLVAHVKVRLWVVISGLVFIAALAILFTAFRFRVASQNRINETVCVAINNQNKLITLTLLRSRTNIAHLTYYRDHRDELAQQRLEITRELRLFRPREC